MSDKFFGQGIPVSAGFDLGSPKPLDSRTVAKTMEELEAMPAVRKYVGLTVYVEEVSAKYIWNGESWEAEINSGLDGTPGRSIFVSSATEVTPYAGDEEFGDNYIDASTVKGSIEPRQGDIVILATGAVYIVTDYFDNIAADESQTKPAVFVKDTNINIKGADGSKGDKGDPFTIAKTYESIEAMEADFSNADVAEGSFIMISSDVEDEDNAKLYVKGATSFTFITDLSGAQGIKGEAATVEVGTVEQVDSDAALEITNAGNSTNAKFNFKIPKAKDGDQIKAGTDYATAQDATVFLKVVSIINDDDAESGLDNAEVNNAGIDTGNTTV